MRDEAGGDSGGDRRGDCIFPVLSLWKALLAFGNMTHTTCVCLGQLPQRSGPKKAAHSQIAGQGQHAYTFSASVLHSYIVNVAVQILFHLLLPLSMSFIPIPHPYQVPIVQISTQCSHPKQIFNDSSDYLPFTTVVLTETCPFTCYMQASTKHSPRRYGVSL